MNIFHSVAELAGNTPLLELCRYERRHGLNARILAKLECCNVAGSAKDRVAKHMIERAEAEGKLVPGSVIIEPTSGNTGIGLAAMAKVHGYRVILTMPESMSVERRNLLKAYGAELVLTPAAEGMAGAVKRAEEMAAATPKSLTIPQIPRRTISPPAPSSGAIPTAASIFSSLASARAAHSPAQDAISKRKIRMGSSWRSSRQARRCSRAARPGCTD